MWTNSPLRKHGLRGGDIPIFQQICCSSACSVFFANYYSLVIASKGIHSSLPGHPLTHGKSERQWHGTQT
jgi:hypothetical protein